MFAVFLPLTKHNRPIAYSLVLCVAVFVSSCHDKIQKRKWENVAIDPIIGENIALRQLDKEKEVFSLLEHHDTSAKRSSGVLYFTKGHVNLSDSNSAKLNNCKAYFFKSGILKINIGIGNGFGGWGFIIHYKDKKFYTEPYCATDVVIANEPEPVFEVVYQNLTLDKPSNKLGDSVYGKINFKVIETDQEGDKINHDGNGYFRTRAKEL